MKDQASKEKERQAPVQQKAEEATGHQLAPPPFQLKADNPPAAPPSQSGGGSSGGSSGLPNDVKGKMENSFGSDFSNVKIETNSDKATQMGAQAYTQGNTVAFAPGKFNPGSQKGQELIGHELSHVVQQREGRVQPTTQAKTGAPVNDDKGLEREADVQGAKAARGEKAGNVAAGKTSMASGPVQKSTDYDALAARLKEELDEYFPDVSDVVDVMQQVPPGGFQNLNRAYNLISPQTPLVTRLQQRFSGNDYALITESVAGMSVEHTPTGAVRGTTGPSLFTLRAGPSTDSPVIGQLDGNAYPIVVAGKGTGSDLVWFRIRFQNQEDYEAVTGTTDNSGATGRAAEFLANREAFVAESALNLYVEWPYFMEQIALFDVMTNNLSIQDKITQLRQMCHDENLPFDMIIGSGEGNYFKDNRPDTHRFFQILDSAQGVQTPNGEIIDMYHFLVGLDVYQAGRRSETSGDWMTGDVGPNHAAATWAGDIGAAVGDFMVEASSDMENQLNGRDERMEFYFNTRAPRADLLADLDAWGAFQQVDSGQVNNLTALINNYYGAQRGTGEGFAANRARALNAMFGQYGFTVQDGSLNTVANQAIAARHISSFARVWLKRHAGLSSLWTSPDIEEMVQVSWDMGIMFLQFLEEQARANGVM